MPRNSSTKVFLLLFVFVLLILQLSSLKQQNRFVERVDKLAEIIENQPRAIPDFRNYDCLPNEGDWLIWGYASEPKTLNQISVNRDIYCRWMCFETIFEPLLTYNYDTVKLEPLLAKSYDISQDGLAITVSLKDDIYFSDGVAVTADDVLFTYQTIINPLIDAADLAQSYMEVDRVEKLDDKTVKFVMKRPYFLALELAAMWDVGIYPKHIYDFNSPAEFNRRVSNPVGSGPYVFEKWNAGEQIVFNRNENYWGHKPNIKKVIYKFILNDTARLQALQTGTVDIIIPSPDQYMELLKDSSFTKKFNCLTYWNPGVPFIFIGWNQRTEIFSDVRVRLAMTHLINRDAICNKLLNGSVKPVTGPYFIYSCENDPNITPWPYDKQKADELLTQAGWFDFDGDGIRDRNGKKFSFKFSYSADYVPYQKIANYLKDSAAKLGIEVIADPLEWSVLITNMPEHDFDAVIMGWGGSIITDNYQIFHSSQIDNRGANYFCYKNAEADELMSEIRSTIDDGKRIVLSRRLHRILHLTQPVTFVFTRPTYRIVDKRFENVKVHTLGLEEEEWFVPKAKQKYR